MMLAIFVLAGTVKGVVGLGLPTVSLALFTVTLGLQEAMVLMLAPSFVTNLWQGLAGSALAGILARLWHFLLIGFACTFVTVKFLGHLLEPGDSNLLTALLGLTLLAYAAFGLVSRRLPSPGRKERWFSPIVAAITGTLAGLTGSFTVPAVPYFQSMGLPRDTLVQAMGVWFTVATVAIAVALQEQRMLSLDQAGLSALGILPALLGMTLGRKFRHTLSEAAFRKVFFAALGALGVYIILRSLV